MESVLAKPVSEDKSEIVSSMLLINYLYLIADLENESKAMSTKRCVLVKLIHLSLPPFLIRTVRATIISLSLWRARLAAVKMMGRLGKDVGVSLHVSGSNLDKFRFVH